MQDADDDARLLRGIIAHCGSKLEDAACGRSPADARHRAYARVMRAARELLEELEGREPVKRA